MSMNELIIDTLKPLGFPVDFHESSNGKENTYITFFWVNERGSMFEDDDEKETEFLLQVDVWSKVDYTETVERVKTFLKEVGFRRTNEQGFYEKGTKIFHKAITFSFTKHS